MKSFLPNKKIECCCDLALTISDFYPLGDRQEREDKCNIVVQSYDYYKENGIVKPKCRLRNKIEKRITFAQYRYDKTFMRLVHSITDDLNKDIRIIISFQKTAKRSNRHYLVYAENIRKKFPGIRIYEDMTVDEFCEILSSAGNIISVKMHPLIVSASYGVRTIAISQHYKIDGFMNWIGRDSYCYRNDSFYSDIITNQLKNINEADEKFSSLEIQKRKKEIYELMDNLKNQLRVEIDCNRI